MEALLLFAGVCVAVYLCRDSIWFSSLSQQKHLNPTHLTLAQKGWCDVSCVCWACVRVCATANVHVWSIHSRPVFYFLGDWGSTQKATTVPGVVPFLCFSSAHKDRQKSGQKIQLLASESKETQTHELHARTSQRACPRRHELEQIYAHTRRHAHTYTHTRARAV